MRTRRSLDTENNQLAASNARLIQENAELRDHNAQLAQHNADLTTKVITFASELINALARTETTRHAYERELEAAHRMVKLLAEDRLDQSKTGTPTPATVPAPRAEQGATG